MATFDNLPTETRVLILQHLCSTDLRSFLISQATCSTFHLLAQEVLSHPQGLPRAAEEEEEDDDEEEENEENKKQRGGPASSSLSISTTPQTSLSPVLARAFAPLFSSAACFTAGERRRARWFLSLNGDVSKPFRRLPWATRGAAGDGDGDDDGRRRGREAYLRPGASWRGVSVTLGRGPPVTRLEVVKSYSSEDLNEEGRDHVQHLLVDLSSSSPVHGSPSSFSPSSAADQSSSRSSGGAGFLTMGMLYDLLLTHGPVGDHSAATFGSETGAWDLLLGRRLRSYELLVEYECFIPDDAELVDLCPEAEGSAILYVRGGTTVEAMMGGGDQDRRFEGGEDDDGPGERWVPEMLGERPRIGPADVP